MNIITSILPRAEEQEKSKQAQRRKEGRGLEARAARGHELDAGGDKREGVRGGCPGAEGRRRTRRPAKRARGAAYERGALRIRMGQPAWDDAQASRGEYIATRGAGGELKHLSSCTNRNQPRFP